MHSITGLVPALSKTDRPGLGACPSPAPEVPTGPVSARSSFDQNQLIGTKKYRNHGESCPKNGILGILAKLSRPFISQNNKVNLEKVADSEA